MRISLEAPPNYSELVAAFPFLKKRRAIIYCWGSTIHNPGRISLPPSLVAHESLHSRQQTDLGGPERWWARYIADVQFRLDQELPAHREEYAVASAGLGRNERRQHLRGIARRLAGPLYNGLLSLNEAKRMICPRDAG